MQKGKKGQPSPKTSVTPSSSTSKSIASGMVTPSNTPSSSQSWSRGGEPVSISRTNMQKILDTLDKVPPDEKTIPSKLVKGYELSEEGRFRWRILDFVKLILFILIGATAALLIYFFSMTIYNKTTMDILTTYIQAQGLLVDTVVKLFQLIVSSTLIPLITLFLGYAFGKRMLD